MPYACLTLRSLAVAAVVAVATGAWVDRALGQEAAASGAAAPGMGEPDASGAAADSAATDEAAGGFASVQTDGATAEPPAVEYPPSAPGSFFRSAEPLPEAEMAPAAAADDTTGLVDEPAVNADPGDGMSAFGAPEPSFTSEPPVAQPFEPQPFGTPPAVSAPPVAELPPAQPFSPAAPPIAPLSGGSPESSFATPPPSDATRSVLTSPAVDPAASPPFAFDGAAAPPMSAAAEPPGAFDASVADGSVPGSAAGEPADQRPVMPTGPATTLLEGAIASAEAAGGPAVLNGLASRPLPLLEALERSGDRGRRLWITQAYWNLVEKVTVLRWTAEAAERLDLVAPGGDPHDRATLDVAVASRLADVAAARATLVSAQQELVDLVRLPATEPLPWPVDRPLATSYETHFDVLFASRIATGRIRAIHRSLPLQHEEVDARAAAVLAAETAVEMAENDHARGTRGIESVIAAHAALLEQQRALANAVTRYNDDIVEYVMAVADFSVPDEQFATMLIGAPTPWRPPVTLTSAAGPVVGVPTLAVPAGNPPADPAGSATGFLPRSFPPQ